MAHMDKSRLVSERKSDGMFAYTYKTEYGIKLRFCYASDVSEQLT